jgi:hypothetical protein
MIIFKINGIKFITLTTCILYFSCKSEDLVTKPSSFNNNVYNTSYEIEDDINIINKALVILCKNDTIRGSIFEMCAKGVENYFWVSFESLNNELFSNYKIDFFKLINSEFHDKYKLDTSKINIENFLLKFREIGYNPHIVVPNLEKLTNKQLNENRFIDLSVDESRMLTNPLVSSYTHSTNYTNNLNCIKFENNRLVNLTINKDRVCEYIIIYVAMRIVDPFDSNPCDNNGNNRAVYNCAFRYPLCSICEEKYPHNSTITQSSNGLPGQAEIILKLKNINSGTEPNFPCYSEFTPEIGHVFDLGSNKIFDTFGYLASTNGLTYYNSKLSDPININNSVYYNTILEESTLPIGILKYDGNITEKVNCTKTTICSSEIDFHSKGNFTNVNELAGGIYSVSRLNGLPYYFYYPGHLTGSILYISGPDNIINYDLIGGNPSVDFCSNGFQILALQESFKYSSSCKYCTPSYNSLNLDPTYFLNTNKNYLLDYWYKDALNVAISYSVTNDKTPEANIIEFVGGDGNSNCNLSISNKTLIATFNKRGNEIDQFKHFNIFENSGANFFIEANVQFKSGKVIRNCGVINTVLSNKKLKGAAIVPRGNISSLIVNVYKIN